MELLATVLALFNFVSRRTANIGRSIGLSRNMIVRKISSFLMEYVSRTDISRIPTMPLASQVKNTEKAIIHKDEQVNHQSDRGSEDFEYLFHLNVFFFFIILPLPYCCKDGANYFSFERAEKMSRVSFHRRSWPW